MEPGFSLLATVLGPVFGLQRFYSRWDDPVMARANRLSGHGGIFHVTHRVLDLDRLCWRLQAGSLADVRENLEAALGEQIAQERFQREPCWTEGLAVGSAAYLERIRPLILSRQETELAQQDRETWVLQEDPMPYGAKTSSKNPTKRQN